MKRTTSMMLAGALVVGSLVAVPSATATAAAALTPDPIGDAASSADNMIATRPAELFLSDADTLVRTGVQSGGNGLKYVTYERSYHGLSVIGGDAVVVTNASGAVLNMAAAQEAPITADTTPAVTADAARATAKSRLAEVHSTSSARLVVLAEGNRLAWETKVGGIDSSGRPAGVTVYVDAKTGEFAGSRNSVLAGTGNGFYSGSVTIGTSGSGTSFSMSDPSRPGLRCGGTNGATFTGTDDNWGNGSGTNLETACVDALYAADKEWDMLASWLGRSGFNGSGSGFPIQVGINDVNAFWFPDQQFTQFGHSQDGTRQATDIDVVGHEFGHSIFQFTSGGNGADSDIENGGLNEGTGDIFGTLTEHFANNPNNPPDFDIGEESDLFGTGPLRRMYNPGSVGDPNCYSASAMTEVHAAAGPLDHWFYLLARGSNPAGGPASPICSGGPSSVTGVGIQTAGQVYYNAMLAKTSTWKYRNVRVASLNAAKNLFPGSCTVFNTVRDAWNAVAVGVQTGEPTCTVGGNDFSIALNPTSRSVVQGSSTTVTVNTAVTSGSAQTVNLSATGLPSGATASFSPASVTAGGSSTLTIQTAGTTPTGTFTVTVTGTGTVSHSAPLALTVTAPGGGCASPGQKLGNPGFESGSTPWTATSGVIGAFSGQTAHGGTRFAWMDGYGQTHTDTLAQTVTLPAGCSAYTFSFWLHIDSSETTTSTQFDRLSVQVLNTSGTVLSTLATYSNLNKAAGYSQKSFSLASFAGQTIQLKFTGTEDVSLQTSFVVDDTALNVS